MFIKLAICDDEELVRIKLSTIINEYFKSIKRQILVIDFRTGEEFLKSGIRFDVVFLDIEMPIINGIETAKKLRKWDVNSKIIYVTNNSNYKDCAYKVHAFDYISKPVTERTINNVLHDVVRYLDNTSENHKYAFKTDEGFKTLFLEDIYYFEYLARKVRIINLNGKYTASYSLKELYGRLNTFNFESPHKSYIVNMSYVKYIKGFDIIMENGDTIPLAQKKAVKFKELFNDFLQTTFNKI